MKAVELIGGPYDGASAKKQGALLEGAQVVVTPSGGGPAAVYTFRNGLLEFDAVRTFRGGFDQPG